MGQQTAALKIDFDISKSKLSVNIFLSGWNFLIFFVAYKIELEFKYRVYGFKIERKMHKIIGKFIDYTFSFLVLVSESNLNWMVK